MNCITEKELIVIKEFRKRLVDVLPDDKDDFNNRDDSLIRWLRAREMHVDKAEEMFRNSMQWRANNRIDFIPDLKDPELETKFPYYLDGVDRKGRPVVTLAFGTWDVRSLIESDGGMQRYNWYCNQLLERILREIKRRTFEPINGGKANNENADGVQFVIVGDMTGYSYRQVANVKALQSMMQMASALEAHYPETLAKYVVINAPAIFSVLFAMCKPFLAGRTVEKIQVFSNKKDEWQPTVLELIAPEQIRERFGGTKMD